MTPGLGIEPEPHWREASALPVAPSQLSSVTKWFQGQIEVNKQKESAFFLKD